MSPRRQWVTCCGMRRGKTAIECTAAWRQWRSRPLSRRVRKTRGALAQPPWRGSHATRWIPSPWAARRTRSRRWQRRLTCVTSSASCRSPKPTAGTSAFSSTARCTSTRPMGFNWAAWGAQGVATWTVAIAVEAVGWRCVAGGNYASSLPRRTG
jgi:hypothetical protein